MRKQLLLITLAVFLYGCNEKSIAPCDCCETSYLKIDDALSCIESNPRETSFDDRLILIAFNNLTNKGWDVIEDLEIITVAKRNYLLVLANKDEINSYAKVTPELRDLIKKYDGQESFFIVVNQALYPFRDWDANVPKNRIISELQLGNGP